MNQLPRFSRCFAFASILALPALPAAAAETCGIDRYTTNTYKGLCDFSRFFGAIAVRIAFNPPQRLPLPNLVPRGMRYGIAGNLVDVATRVANDSLVLPAGAHDVHVVITVMRQGVIVDTVPLVMRFARIAAGGSARVFMGQIWIADRSVDNDLLAAISVDSPTVAAPLGSVVEANEMDNTATEICRIYGTLTSDPSVGPCN